MLFILEDLHWADPSTLEFLDLLIEQVPTASILLLLTCRWVQQNMNHQAEAEACFHQALNVARQQQAKSLELRAAISLSRLWRQQGKCDEARDLLATIYNWFTAGFNTPFLKQTRGLFAFVELAQ